MQKIEVDDVIKHLRFRRKINNINFDNIEWIHHGMPCFFSDEEIEKHKFSGLNNMDFIATHFII